MKSEIGGVRGRNVCFIPGGASAEIQTCNLSTAIKLSECLSPGNNEIGQVGVSDRSALSLTTAARIYLRLRSSHDRRCELCCGGRATHDEPASHQEEQTASRARGRGSRAGVTRLSDTVSCVIISADDCECCVVGRILSQLPVCLRLDRTAGCQEQFRGEARDHGPHSDVPITPT